MMGSKFFRLFLIGGLMFLCVQGWSQVSGVVTDAETGEPLIGANILIKGTSTGTITDFDGNYTLDANDGDVLVFSYTGYADQEITVSGSTLNLEMSAGEQLDEVVVVGYGVVKKRDVTGSVASISTDDIQAGAIVSTDQLLQGRASGVQITNNSGEPGGGVSVRIRGTSSIRSGNGPLFVVDGVPLDAGGNSTENDRDVATAGQGSGRNPLNFINPADIESIDILKDASATAIYGSRGANGVVLITTKSGKGSNAGLSYSGSVSLSSITEKYDLLEREAFLDGAEALGASRSAIDLGGNTDWQDEIFQSAFGQSHNLSYGGGDDKTNYRVSLGYQDQEGIIKESGVERVTGRINATHKLWDDRVTLNAGLTIANINSQYAPNGNTAGFAGDVIGAALSANPTQPIRDANGDYIQRGNNERNPVAWLDYHDDNETQLRMLANVSGTWNITSDLSYKLNFGYDRSKTDRRYAESRLFNTNNTIGRGVAIFYDLYADNTLLEHTLNYNKAIGTSNLNALVGYSYQEFDNGNTTEVLRNFLVDDLGLMINNAQAVDFNQNDSYRVRSSRSVDELQSYFGRIIYSMWNSKLVLTGTVRVDGSSKFGEDNRYGTFPSFAAAYRLTDLAFLPESMTDLKLRAGWGITGNQEFPGGNQLSRFRYDNNGNLTAVSFANPDLQWEQTEQINVGLDWEFNSGKIYGAIDYFNKTTTDLLIQTRVAQPAPREFIWENLDGEVVNSGVELSVGAYVIENENTTWNLTANATFLDNEVKNLGRTIRTGQINGQGLSGAFSEVITDGQPLYAYFLRTFQGFDSEGFNIYAGNEDVSLQDKSPLPKFNLGLTNDFKFGNFNVNFFINGVFGHYIYNNTANAYFTAGSLGNGRNTTTDVVGNGEARFNAPDASTRFLEKGDFLRLQNMTVGYNFPLETEAIRSMYVYLTGTNLVTITDYSGQDPEVDTNKAIDDVPSAGIDYISYPRARAFTLGVNLSF